MACGLLELRKRRYVFHHDGFVVFFFQKTDLILPLETANGRVHVIIND